MSKEVSEVNRPAPATGFTVRFKDGGATFNVPDGQPVLAAAAQAGIEMPSSCRNGSCRTCMCQLVSGEVRYRIQWPGLLPEELAARWILPCIAYPQSDLVLRRPRGPLASITAPDWRSSRSLNQ
jgi:ferredoxin